MLSNGVRLAIWVVCAISWAALLFVVGTKVMSVGKGVGHDLGLDFLTDGLGHLLNIGDTVDHLLNMAPLQRKGLGHLLWVVDTVLGGHLLASVLDSGDLCGRSGNNGGCWSNGGSVMVEEGVSLGVSLGLTLLEDDVGGAGWAMLGGDLLADDLNLNIVVVDVSGDTLSLQTWSAVLGLEVLVLGAAVWCQGVGVWGEASANQELRIGLGLWLRSGEGQ